MPYREIEDERKILVIGLNGVVVGLDRETGAILWKNDLKGGGVGRVAVAIAEGKVFASAEGDKLFCLDYLTGQTLWEQKTSHSGDNPSILVERDVLYVSKWGYIDCFTTSGEKLWSQELKGLGVGHANLKLPPR